MGQDETPAIVTRRYPGKVGGQAGSIMAIQWAAGILGLLVLASILSAFFISTEVSFILTTVFLTLLSFVITLGIEREALMVKEEESNRLWLDTYYEFKVPRDWPLVNIARRMIASLEGHGMTISRINVRGYHIGFESPYRGIMMGMRVEPDHRQIYFLVAEEAFLFGGRFPHKEAAAIVVTPIEKPFDLEKDPVAVIVAKVLWNQEVMNLRKGLDQTLSDHDLMGLPRKRQPIAVDPKYQWMG